MSPLQLGIPN